MTRLRAVITLVLLACLGSCATQYVGPLARPTAQLNLVSRAGGSPVFWHDDSNGCAAEKLGAFGDDSLYQIGALMQGKPLHAVQTLEVPIEAERQFVLTAAYGGARCSISYKFFPHAGEHYEADSRGVCIVRIIHISKALGETDSTRTFEPTAERVERPCSKN